MSRLIVRGVTSNRAASQELVRPATPAARSASEMANSRSVRFMVVQARAETVTARCHPIAVIMAP